VLSAFPYPIHLLLLIIGFALMGFSLVQTSHLARNGQRYFEEIDPTIHRIRSESNGEFPQKVTITSEQFTALARGKRFEPSTKVDATTLTVLFSLGVFITACTRASLHDFKSRSRDRSTSPND
jgi:hypothetical protein